MAHQNKSGPLKHVPLYQNAHSGVYIGTIEPENSFHYVIINNDAPE